MEENILFSFGRFIHTVPAHTEHVPMKGRDLYNVHEMR